MASDFIVMTSFVLPVLAALFVAVVSLSLVSNIHIVACCSVF